MDLLGIDDGNWLDYRGTDSGAPGTAGAAILMPKHREFTRQRNPWRLIQ